MPDCSAESAPGFPPRKSALPRPPHGQGHGLRPGSLRSQPCSSSRAGTRCRGSEESRTAGPSQQPLRGSGAGGRRGRLRPAAAEAPPLSRSRPRSRPSPAPCPGRGCGRRTRGSGDTARDGARMGRTLVELYYDVISPYSWLAFEVLCRYRHIWNIDLRFRPAFLGGIMQQTGNKPPAMLPKRGEYMMKDMKRMAKYYQVPLHVSADDFQRIIGTSSLAAMRFITAMDMTNPQYLEPLSREFWMRFWSQHEDISQPENILAVARQAGLSAELSQKTLEMISSPPVKDRLKETTAEALKHGAFGMPAVVAHYDGKPHLFFGSDRLELLGSVIGEKWLGPVPSPKL